MYNDQGHASSDQDQKHPHAKSGPNGGQFVKKGSGGGSSAPDPRHTALKAAITKVVADMRSQAAPAKPAKPKRSSLRAGGKNDPAAVKRLQQLLDDLGLGKVGVDGQFGASTVDAVKAAQQKLGLKPTGVASASLVDKMSAAKALSPCMRSSSSAAVRKFG